ncbi:MAG: hypothetical protein P4L99_21190, partial [Chthoniobacter sp.]|nr:hypothetical protein [Chthoniobacter sp.]
MGQGIQKAQERTHLLTMSTISNVSPLDSSLRRTARRRLLTTAIATLTVVWSSACLAKTLYVAPDGNDAWSGTLAETNAAKTDGCFATLDRARNEIRKLKTTGGLPKEGVVVEIRGGVYQLSSPFSLTAEDSGTEGVPIVWRARAGEKVRITGGAQITNFKPVSDPAVLKRIDESARGHVLQADLNELRIKNIGRAVGAENGYRLELFFQDKPMTLARWPNTDYTHISDVEEGKDDPARPPSKKPRSSKIGRFIYEGDRPNRWADEKDIWLHGF